MMTYIIITIVGGGVGFFLGHMNGHNIGYDKGFDVGLKNSNDIMMPDDY